MWRSKKFIIAVLAVIVLGATLGGVAIAQADDENSNNQTQAVKANILDKVSEIYEKNTGTAINPDELQKAFTEARQAIQDEALDNFLQKLVTDGKITQEQADQYKAWLDARPAFPTEEFKNWMESRPDIPGLFGQRGQGGFMPFNRMKGGMMPFGGMQGGPGGFGGGIGERFQIRVESSDIQ
jgi:hypothetical protein